MKTGVDEHKDNLILYLTHLQSHSFYSFPHSTCLHAYFKTNAPLKKHENKRPWRLIDYLRYSFILDEPGHVLIAASDERTCAQLREVSIHSCMHGSSSFPLFQLVTSWAPPSRI